jgi:ribulose-5-phosphate 4-epimerase/fuculose-1-phosphate aldolase
MAPSVLLPDPQDVPKTKAVIQSSPNRDEMTPLQAISQGVSLPGIPIFNDFEKHRHWILEHMALAFRVLARKGFSEGIVHPSPNSPACNFLDRVSMMDTDIFVPGMSGHISIRDPENPHSFWTNPLGRHFSLLKPSDMILVDYHGKPIGGNVTRPANAAGFLIHSALHKARPDVDAAVHMHSKFGKAWSAFAKPLEMLNQDICYLYGEAQAVYTEFGGVVFSEAEGERLAAALGERGKALILRNHGLLTVGSTVDEAAYLFSLMERSCEVQLAVEAATKTGLEKVLVPQEAAEYTFKMASDPEALYWEFQPDLEAELDFAGKGWMD